MKMKKVVTNHSYKRIRLYQGNGSVMIRRPTRMKARRTRRIVMMMMMRRNNEE